MTLAYVQDCCKTSRLVVDYTRRGQSRRVLYCYTRDSEGSRQQNSSALEGIARGPSSGASSGVSCEQS